MKAADHAGCTGEDSYPDLSMSLTQRNKIKEDRLREERNVVAGPP